MSAPVRNLASAREVEYRLLRARPDDLQRLAHLIDSLSRPREPQVYDYTRTALRALLEEIL